MKKFRERLDELKAEMEIQLESRIIFLLNPKDTTTLEAVIAWNVGEHEVDCEVPDDAPMEYLWEICPADLSVFTATLNVKPVQAMARFEQLRRLGIIYPDGSVASLAKKVAGLYIRSQVKTMEDKIMKGRKDERIGKTSAAKGEISGS